MTTETVEVPANPFTLVEGNKGVQWLEYESKLPIPAAPSVGERRMQFRMIPMRLDSATEHFQKVMQLMKRCEHFEKECERLQGENDELHAERELLQEQTESFRSLLEKLQVAEINQSHMEEISTILSTQSLLEEPVAAKSGKRGRRQRGE